MITSTTTSLFACQRERIPGRSTVPIRSQPRRSVAIMRCNQWFLASRTLGTAISLHSDNLVDRFHLIWGSLHPPITSTLLALGRISWGRSKAAPQEPTVPRAFKSLDIAPGSKCPCNVHGDSHAENSFKITRIKNTWMDIHGSWSMATWISIRVFSINRFSWIDSWISHGHFNPGGCLTLMFRFCCIRFSSPPPSEKGFLLRLVRSTVMT